MSDLRQKARNLRRPAAACALLLAAGGCSNFNWDQYDPLYRDGVWQPTHVNRADLTMMAANPADLVHGKGATGADGVVAAAAVDRLHQNKVKRLPDAGLAEVKVQGQGGGGE